MNILDVRLDRDFPRGRLTASKFSFEQRLNALGYLYCELVVGLQVSLFSNHIRDSIIRICDIF
jgi:hypothetical protein